MKPIKLPEVNSYHIHLECFRDDGSSYCIETKRCNVILVENCVLDVVLTDMGNPRHKQVMSRGWESPGGSFLGFKHKVDFVLA